MYRLNSSNAGIRINNSGIAMSCGFTVSSVYSVSSVYGATSGLIASLYSFSPASECVNL